MKPLIAVMTCWSNVAAADAIRRTWAKSSPIPVRFFLGPAKKGLLSRPTLADEVLLNVSDDYEHLVHKVKATFLWARANGFTHVWKADDDCYLAPERLLRSGLLSCDHVGSRVRQSRQVPGDVICPKGFLHGGASYVVGERALPVLCAATAIGFSEDGWVTNQIERAGLKSEDDRRFSFAKRTFGDPTPLVPERSNDQIAGGELITLMGGRSEMYLIHRQFKG